MGKRFDRKLSISMVSEYEERERQGEMKKGRERVFLYHRDLALSALKIERRRMRSTGPTIRNLTISERLDFAASSRFTYFQARPHLLFSRRKSINFHPIAITIPIRVCRIFVLVQIFAIF